MGNGVEASASKDEETLRSAKTLKGRTNGLTLERVASGKLALVLSRKPMQIKDLRFQSHFATPWEKWRSGGPTHRPEATDQPKRKGDGLTVWQKR